MAMEITNNYSNYTSQYLSGNGSANGINKKDAEPGTVESTKTQSTQDYLKALQKKVPYVELETGMSLSMKRDKRSVIAVNPKLLEKMQNDPEAEKQYTQTLKDIERAEKTVDAYYNALGGVVERTSHWYVDENGKYYHFAYTRRDDKLNKKIREETKKNSEKLIEKTREKSRKKAKELKEKLEEKAEEAKEEKAKEENKQQDSSVNTQAPDAAVMEAAEKMLSKKLEHSENGEIYLNETDMQPVMAAIRKAEDAAAESSARAAGQEAGSAVDIKV